jgi:hypothetical protein
MDRIRIVRREYLPHQWTNDVYVDGELYVRAVGDTILAEIVRRIVRTIGTNG